MEDCVPHVRLARPRMTFFQIRTIFDKLVKFLILAELCRIVCYTLALEALEALGKKSIPQKTTFGDA